MRRRDSLFGEPVIWSGRPKVITTPLMYRVAAAVCAVTAAIATASAVVVATALGKRPSELFLFTAWMATLAVAFASVPRWWRSELEFIVTDKHIVMRRGRLRRSIERRQVSFARIHWNPRVPGIGDLELVRAVPTGALQRRLSIVLSGLVAPDRVWAIIRGVTPAAPAGDGQLLLAQRLDEGERVLWSGHPARGVSRIFPTGARSLLALGIACAFAGAAVFVSVRAVHSLRVVVRAGLHPESASFIALVISLSLTIVLLATAAVIVFYVTIVRPIRLDARTRYLITDRRVLIQRGDEELHLDRSRIVDVITSPSAGGHHDVFLVLDGPRARAVAASGAFGEAQSRGLHPVLHRVSGIEEVERVLGLPPSKPSVEDSALSTPTPGG